MQPGPPHSVPSTHPSQDESTYLTVPSFTSGNLTLANVTLRCIPEERQPYLSIPAATGQDLQLALQTLASLGPDTSLPAVLRLLRNATLALQEGWPEAGYALHMNTTLNGTVPAGQAPPVLDLGQQPALVAMQQGAALRLANLQLQGTCTRAAPLPGLPAAQRLQSTPVFAVQGPPSGWVHGSGQHARHACMKVVEGQRACCADALHLCTG